MSLNKIISTILGIWVVATFSVMALFSYQTKMLYPAPDTQVLTQLPAHVQKIAFGQSYGYLLQPPSAANIATTKQRPLIIYTHGNGEIIDSWVNSFEPLMQAGFAVLLVEYPGYGNATGSPSKHALSTTVIEAYDTVIARNDINKEQVIAYGRSMGGAAAALLAKQRPLKALALESTFASLPQLVKEMGFPSFALRDRYQTAEIVSALDIPVFVYHSTNDDVIPFHHAKQIEKAAKNGTFHSAECGHNCPTPFPEVLAFIDQQVNLEL